MMNPMVEFLNNHQLNKHKLKVCGLHPRTARPAGNLVPLPRVGPGFQVGFLVRMVVIFTHSLRRFQHERIPFINRWFTFQSIITTT